jgi:multidrug transporter EmrE-like cation transporter
MATGSIVLAIVLEVVAGSLVSLSMVVQRHALIYPNPEGSDGKVPLLCVRIGRWRAWFVGLIMYGIASALKIVGFNLGPLTILGSIFVGALLVTNLFLGHWLLREEVTVTKVVGSLLVLCGSIVVIAATPSGVPTSFTSADMQRLLLSFEALYLVCIVLIVLICFVFILYVERTYPPPTTQAARKLRAIRAASRAALSPTSPPSLHVAHPTVSHKVSLRPHEHKGRAVPHAAGRPERSETDEHPRRHLAQLVAHAEHASPPKVSLAIALCSVVEDERGAAVEPARLDARREAATTELGLGL